jgi:hypothetical protein
MQTVIGFDSWTGGARHYISLVPALKKINIDLKLIHIGSWGHDQGRPLHEMIGELPVFDIAYYGDKNLLEVLELENPAAIIFLSTQAFAHQAVNRYSMLLGIPTLHLYHGLISVQAVETGHPDNFNFFAQLKLFFIRAWKNLSKLLPTYIKSLFDTHASIAEWLEFARDVMDKVIGRYTIVASKDTKTDYCAVYTSQDIQHALIKYRVDRENIRVVGNPDLIKFNLLADDFGNFTSIKNSKNKIMYIDHGGSTCALNFKSPDAFITFLEATDKALQQQGYSLIVKLHPSQGNTDTPENIKGRGIELSSNTTFLSDLRGCCAAISGPSTASLIPALMGLPLLLAQFGEFNGQEYGKALLSYPRCILLKEITDIKKLLFDNRENYEPAKLVEWISLNAGPLPPEEMPERVAAIVEEMTVRSNL